MTDRHLCYSLNAFAGKPWDADGVIWRLVAALRRELKAENEAFGLGLWINDADSLKLTTGAALAELKSRFDDDNLYVFTVNAFPYGTFHGQPVKDAVYRPNWAEPARLEYTERVAWILAELLPDGLDGSISTLPGAYRRHGADPAEIEKNLAAAAAVLAEIRHSTGKTIRLAVEMEPDCLWETPAEFAEFYRDFKKTHSARADFIGVCYDTCHQELLGTVPGSGLELLLAGGVPVPKIQLSAAVAAPDAEAKKVLAAEFADPVYLHQTRVFGGTGRRDFPDLPEALRDGDRSKPWRVHFHVPIHLGAIRGLPVLDGELSAVLDFLKANQSFHPHLEIETYTHAILSGGDVVSIMAAEYNRCSIPTVE